MREYKTCVNDYRYFVNAYCYIYDNLVKDWIPFSLWPFQAETLDIMHQQRALIILKARQLGATWLKLAHDLHKMLFHPIITSLMFSMRDTEVIELLSDGRLRGMYNRLPWWMKAESILIDHKHLLKFSNESSVRGLVAGTGDSYTATDVLIDEADLIDDLDQTLTRVRPTIDAGGYLVLLSRIDKRKSGSTFKLLYKNALLKKNNYHPLFWGWQVHPLRDEAWYENIVANATHIDEVYEQYPATIEEALARGTVGKIYPRFSMVDNVHEEAAYVSGYPVIWTVDDGYVNPLCIALIQERPFMGFPDHSCVFAEFYKSLVMHDEAIKEVLLMGYPPPIEFWYDPSAARLAGEFQRIRDYGIRAPDGSYLVEPFECQINAADNDVANGIKATRALIGPDMNGVRRLRIHPTCENIIRDILDYHTAEAGAIQGGDIRPVKEGDHGADTVRYYCISRYIEPDI